MGEVFDGWKLVSESFGERLGAVRADQWGAPTPCAEWDVRALVDHAVGAQRMVISQVPGAEDIEWDLGDDAGGSWRRTRAAAIAALSAPGALETEVDGPMGRSPAETALGITIVDLYVHTWDLARAIGADETLDAGLAEAFYARLQPLDAMLRGPGYFGARIEPPPGADAQTRLLSFLGRAV
ncbi:MAG: TIGR03086 family protein [Acidimicrobiales bacterium]|nr:TIGR03086 family protein [Acidimicrobiales bacterium]